MVCGSGFMEAHDVCVQCLLAWVTPVREYVECIYDFFLSSSDNENSILYISLELRNISSVRGCGQIGLYLVFLLRAFCVALFPVKRRWRGWECVMKR